MIRRLVRCWLVFSMLTISYLINRQEPSVATESFLMDTATQVKKDVFVLPLGEPLQNSNIFEDSLIKEIFATIREEEPVVDSFATLEGDCVDEQSGDELSEEYANLAIAQVTDYVNVRSIPSTEGEILGKIYNGSVAQVLETVGEDDDWFHVISGTVEGYIKSEYFVYGQAAADVVDHYVTRYVLVQADRLNVRKDPSVESKRVGYLDQGEKALLLEDCGDWMKVEYSQGTEGYVSAEFVLLQEEFVYAKSIEEERLERERQKAMEERKNTSEETKPEDTVNVSHPNASYSSNGELRDDIIAYAQQFLGNKYVHGGSSLTTGTDCSGFTSLIYAEFGYSVGRTPASQLSSAGRGIDYSEIQKGDIICYGKNGKCTHVALYIGDGQIIHEANSKKGVVIYQANYDTIIGVRNIID